MHIVSLVVPSRKQCCISFLDAIGPRTPLPEVGPLTAISQVAQTAGQPDAIQLVGRVLTARTPLVAAARQLAAVCLLTARSVSCVISLPQGLDAQHRRILPNAVVPQTRLLRFLAVSPLTTRPLDPPRLRAGRTHGLCIRPPRKAARCSRSPRTRPLTCASPAQKLPTWREIGTTVRRARLRASLVVRRSL